MSLSSVWQDGWFVHCVQVSHPCGVFWVCFKDARSTRVCTWVQSLNVAADGWTGGCLASGAAGVLLSGLVFRADVQRRSGLRSALQHPGRRREKGRGQTHPPEEQLGVRGVQSEPQVPVGAALPRAAGKLPVQYVPVCSMVGLRFWW